MENLSLLLERSCEDLCEDFHSLKTPRDVAALLDVPYKRFVYHLYKEENRYTSFEIPKKSGDRRTISAPVIGLKIIQRKLSQVLYCVYNPKPSVHGFVPAKSILTNALPHVKKRYVLNADLKDFFPSINFGRVRGLFMAAPYGLSPEVATVLAQICCYEGKLPQGAPTSPVVSNMICARMDRQLQHLAKEYRSTYTRYADDITFSTTVPKFPKALAYVPEEGDEKKLILGEKLAEIIISNDFRVNEQKVRLQDKRSHQEVTGLTVNEFPNVDRRYVRSIRAILHAWDKFGLQKAQEVYLEKYAPTPRYPQQEKSSLKQVLHGKIEFLAMVRGKEDQIYQKHIKKYFELSQRDSIPHKAILVRQEAVHEQTGTSNDEV
ncbi:MAG: RNA-directed DNA polymerase [Oscillatoriophycideae cyanobacterium NC_groundwater_1537_Pr4_S-0.65um_50_18]|nr:RNA-directed DNA polymerase [Oscillatoriophycideae cyanobacterium NC_groundwater_1537_Pr4_S-0.65um_50_18]